MTETAVAVSTLSAHTDTNLVTRAQLSALPAVVCTDSFKPVAHIELVETLEKALARRDIRIEREQFSIRADGSRLFGTLDLSLNGIPNSCASLGIRTANDKSMSIQMIAGMRIFVCDNMCFNGDMVCVKRKHTSGLNLFQELEEAVNRYESHYLSLKTEVETLKLRTLTDTDAKAMIYDIVYNRKALPMRLGGLVGDEYFTPRHEEFQPRTAWSLHNAFTEVMKQVKGMNNQMEYTQEIGKYFGLVGQKN
jgi:hypothetical protein